MRSPSCRAAGRSCAAPCAIPLQVMQPRRCRRADGCVALSLVKFAQRNARITSISVRRIVQHHVVVRVVDLRQPRLSRNRATIFFATSRSSSGLLVIFTISAGHAMRCNDFHTRDGSRIIVRRSILCDPRAVLTAARKLRRATCSRISFFASVSRGSTLKFRAASSSDSDNGAPVSPQSTAEIRPRAPCSRAADRARSIARSFSLCSAAYASTLCAPIECPTRIGAPKPHVHRSPDPDPTRNAASRTPIHPPTRSRRARAGRAPARESHRRTPEPQSPTNARARNRRAETACGRFALAAVVETVQRDPVGPEAMRPHRSARSRCSSSQWPPSATPA
jgi:hypothetical protein